MKKSLLAIGLLSGSPALYAEIVVNHVMNPLSVKNAVTPEMLNEMFVAEVGDTITLNLTFLGGQPISIADELWLQVFMFSSDGESDMDLEGNWQFLSPGLNLQANAFEVARQDSLNSLATIKNAENYRTGDGVATFSGITQTLYLAGLHEIDTDNDGNGDQPSVNSRTYNAIALVLGGYYGRVVAAALPEPASWATMVAGFGMAGGMLRYRRRTMAVSFG